MLTPDVRHVALLRRTGACSANDAVRLADALQKQYERDYRAAYPGAEGWAIALYDEPPPEAVPLILADDDGIEGALGHHYQAGGFIGGAVDVQGNSTWTRTASHEFLEIIGNPYLMEWADLPDGSATARELCDAVQETGYEIDGILVSNFVTAAYWQAGSQGPWDHMRLLRGPLTLGPGYWVRIDPNGRKHVEWGMAGSMSARRFTPASRTFRLMQGFGAGTQPKAVSSGG